MLQRPVPSPSTGEGQDGGEARHPEPLMVSLSNHAGGHRLQAAATVVLLSPPLWTRRAGVNRTPGVRKSAPK